MRCSDMREKPNSSPPQPAKTKSSATKMSISLVGMAGRGSSYGTVASCLEGVTWSRMAEARCAMGRKNGSRWPSRPASSRTTMGEMSIRYKETK